METMTENLLEAWGSLTSSQVARGMGWYQSAHDLAWIIAKGDTVKGAGVLAALSPQKSWDINRRLAIRACLEGQVTGQVSDAIGKAQRILAGENPAVVLPKGKKTWHFFMNILRPDDSDFVTIDRHAYRVATCDWDNGTPVIKPKQYAEIVAAYQGGARIVRVPAPAFQAALWIYARER